MVSGTHRSGLARCVALVLIGVLNNVGSRELFAQAEAQPPPMPSSSKASDIHARIDTSTPEGIHQAIASWGVGKKIDVRTATGSHLRGRIEFLESDGFGIRQGRGAVRLRYDDVRKISRAGWPVGVKIALVGGAVVAIAIARLAYLSLCECGY